MYQKLIILKSEYCATAMRSAAPAVPCTNEDKLYFSR